MNETACVHCGFYSEAGGFTISKEDKSFMNSCKSVVSTCTFGGGDDLHQPIGMSDASLQKVCNLHIKIVLLHESLILMISHSQIGVHRSAM